MAVARWGISAFVSEVWADLRLKEYIVLWLTLSLVVSVSGPFGSHGQFSLLQRILFWTPVLGLGVLVSIGVRAFVQRKLGLEGCRPCALFAAALACTLICPPLFVLVSSVFPSDLPPLVLFQEIVLLVGSVSLGAYSLRMAVTETPKTARLPQQESRLIQRLDPSLRGELWAISVRDHYVDVLTERGMASLLLRFSDAMAESEAEGAQVHRSHWVAWAAVESVERDGIRLFLRLKSGGRVPVSKNHRDKLEARGLI